MGGGHLCRRNQTKTSEKASEGKPREEGSAEEDLFVGLGLLTRIRPLKKKGILEGIPFEAG